MNTDMDIDINTVADTITCRLVEARADLGITQKELSERTGIAQGDISKLENGNGNPSVKTLQRLAAAMDMSLKIEFVAT